MSFGLSLWKINYILYVPACFPYTYDRRPRLLHIEFFHTGASILTRSLYPNIFQWFCSLCGLLVVPLWLYLFWGLCHQGSMRLCLLPFFCRVNFKHIAYSLEYCRMVDFLGAWPCIILAWSISVHYDVISLRFFHFWYHMGLRFWCIRFFLQLLFLATFLCLL